MRARSPSNRTSDSDPCPSTANNINSGGSTYFVRLGNICACTRTERRPTSNLRHNAR